MGDTDRSHDLMGDILLQCGILNMKNERSPGLGLEIFINHKVGAGVGPWPSGSSVSCLDYWEVLLPGKPPLLQLCCDTCRIKHSRGSLQTYLE